MFWLAEHPEDLPAPTADVRWREASEVSGLGRYRPTVAATIHLFRRFFHFLSLFIGCDLPCCSGLSLMNFSVHTPQLGVHLTLSKATLVTAHQVLRHFTRNRPIRVVNDISRPLR